MPEVEVGVGERCHSAVERVLSMAEVLDSILGTAIKNE